MLILATILFLFLTALTIVVLHLLRPEFRYVWLIAAGGTFITWFSVLSWQFQLPFGFQLPRWEPTTLFLKSISFTVDSLTWPLAFSVITLIFAVILTATARENFPAPIPWAAILVLGGLGLLAVLADNPLSLLMVWSAIDLTELISQLRSVDGPKSSEKVVAAFTARVAGVGALLWANMVSISTGSPLEFHDAPAQAGIYLLLAVGLRLGVLPLHLPYASESAIRRGFGSTLRLISAASSLVLLARIPATSVISVYTPFLLALTALAAIYGGWMWLRAPDELSARPFWLIGITSLAVASALQGNAVGAVAWGCALLLSGGALFLSSAHHTWLSRALWMGAWGISALPFSITATGWDSGTLTIRPVLPFLLLGQALLLAGYLRHTMRPSLRANYETLNRSAFYIYPLGIGLLLAVVLLLGLWGWDGALQIGSVLPALAGVVMGGIAFRLAPRLRVLTPIRAHWMQPVATSWINWISQIFRGLNHLFGRLSRSFSTILEGDGGIMWALLFLVLFISLMAQERLIP